MANQVRIGVGVVLKGEKDLDKLRDKFEKLQKQGAKGFAIGAGAAATVGAVSLLGSAISGVGDFIGDSTRLASDLNETLSKSGVIFGDSAKTVEAFGDTAANSLGLSKQAAIEAAAVRESVQGSTSPPKAAEMSKAIVGLAGDLASFNNLDPTDVLLKLRSGLSGEAEPLRSLGVFLTEAKVKAKAMEMGLGNAHGELSEGAKLLARYKLITEETTTAQGDFARTADGLANAQRRANAELLDRQAELGAKFLPIQKQITEWQIDFLYGLDIVGDKMGEVAKGAGDFLDFVTPWDGQSHDATSAVAANVEEMAGGFYAAQRAGERLATGIGAKTLPAIWTIPRAADKAGDAIETMGDKFNATWDALTKAGTEAADDIFGPAIRKADLAANARERAAQREIIASKDSTTAQVRDARDRLLALQKEGLGARIEMAGRGELTAKAYAALIAKLQTQAKSGNAEIADSAKTALGWLNKLRDGVDAVGTAHVTITGGKKSRPRASGGPVTGGTPTYRRGT